MSEELAFQKNLVVWKRGVAGLGAGAGIMGAFQKNLVVWKR